MKTPFEITPEEWSTQRKPEVKIFSLLFISFMEHTKNDILDRGGQKIQKRAIFQEKDHQLRGAGELK